jgi:hypothetical protein
VRDQQLLDHAGKASHFVRVKVVKDESPDRADVSRRRLVDRYASGLRDRDIGAAAVVGTLHPLDQPAPLHPGDVVGNATAFPLQ